MSGIEELNLPLLAVGLLLVALGALVPGTQPTAVTTLIVVGSSLSAVAVLAPAYRELEIGPTKFRMARDDPDLEAPPPWMVAQVETLSEIARWVTGDPTLARNAVEATLSIVQNAGRRISRGNREVIKLKTLVACLDKVEQQRALPDRQSNERKTFHTTVGALQELTFDTRIAFALRSQFPAKEVATILESSPERVEAEADRARSAIAASESGEVASER